MKTRGELEQFSWELTKRTLKLGKHVFYNPRQQLYNIDETFNDSTHASPIPTLICNEHSNTIFMTMIIYRLYLLQDHRKEFIQLPKTENSRWNVREWLKTFLATENIRRRSICDRRDCLIPT